MSLRVVSTDDFTADVAEQARWYARQRDEALALDYARTVEATLEFFARHSQPPGGHEFRHSPVRDSGTAPLAPQRCTA